MKTGVVLRKYNSNDLFFLKEVFFSNVPSYFDEREWKDFYEFLQNDINGQCFYDVFLVDEKIVGAGGIYLHDDNSVHMCWGMIHSNYHKTGLGKNLLEHRLRLSNQLFPKSKIVLSTTQHASGFFEKYGFITTKTEKDFWAKGLDLYQMELTDKI